MGEISFAGGLEQEASRDRDSVLTDALAANVLPLTSDCNLNCLFCSNRFNPAGVETFRIRPRRLAEIEADLSLLDSGRPLVIGESATRIIEGEPFTHPDILEVLRLVRLGMPRTPIRLTTNGSLLDEKKVALLAGLGGVTVNLSLNSVSKAGRILLMGDERPEQAVQSAHLLKNYGVPFHGSVVAMPHLVGWPDVEETVRHLSSGQAETIRLFMPGFTRLAPPSLRFAPSLQEELRLMAERLSRELCTPLVCEPPVISSLKPQVAGVIAGSPADRAGVRGGDVLASVAGEAALTRVHAFNLCAAAGPAEIVVLRNGDCLKLRLDKKPGRRSGLVMDYDIDPELFGGLARVVRHHGASRVLALVSGWARMLFKLAQECLWQEEAVLETAVVENRFFGGSIGSAGLLTVEDFLAAATVHMSSTGVRPDLVLLPGIAFDRRGRDLTGTSFRLLEERLDLAVKLL